MSKFSRSNTRAAKLTADQVLEMRRLYHDERWSQGRLAQRYGISSCQVGRIVRGESWQQYGGTVSDDELEHRAATSGYQPTAQELADSMARLDALRSAPASEPEVDLLEQVLKRRGGDDPLRRLPIAQQETRTDEPQETPGSSQAEGEGEPAGTLERSSEGGQQTQEDS